jgi:hypothetical protein
MKYEVLFHPERVPCHTRTVLSQETEPTTKNSKTSSLPVTLPQFTTINSTTRNIRVKGRKHPTHVPSFHHFHFVSLIDAGNKLIILPNSKQEQRDKREREREREGAREGGRSFVG